MAFITCPECNQNISEKAKVCVHCGYPIVEEKPEKVEMPKYPKYQLVSRQDTGCVLASVLRVLAIVAAVGGVIAAIALSIEETYSSYSRRSTDYSFSFVTFLIYLVSFGVTALFIYAFSEVVDKIHQIHYMLFTLEIVERTGKKEERNSAQSGYRFGSTKVAAAGAKDGKACPKCGRMNPVGTAICKDCGASMY